MSIAALQWAYGHRLPAIQKAVLVAMAYRHNAKSGRCDPSIETLAGMTGLSERALRYAINDLATAEVIRIERRRIGCRQTSNAYVLNLANRYSKSARIAPSRRVQPASGAPSSDDFQPAHTSRLADASQPAPGAPNREERYLVGRDEGNVVPFQGLKNWSRS